MAIRSKTKSAAPSRTIAFQGQPGAYSHLACRRYFPDMAPMPTAAFEDTFKAVSSGRAKLAMIPIENSVAGQVADIHRIMPDSGLHIVGERFLRVNHHLLAPPGATLKSVNRVHSHVHALGQCGNFLRKHNLEAVVHADTAGAAADIAAADDKTEAAIASELAGEVYGLKSIRANIEDAEHNTTRFIILSKKPVRPKRNGDVVVTSFVFRVRNVPAALFKALGGHRDQRRQHDQAGELHGGRRLLRDAVLCRCRGRSARPQRQARLRGAGFYTTR